MRIALDVDSGLPGDAAVHRSRDTDDMHIGEERRSIRSCGYGTHPLAEGPLRCRLRLPSPRTTYHVRRRCRNHAVARSLRSRRRATLVHRRSPRRPRRRPLHNKRDQTQRWRACSIRRRAREGETRSIDDRERSSIAVRGQRALREFLLTLPTGDDQHPIAPCSHKYR
jgi:hypothetical protein